MTEFTHHGALNPAISAEFTSLSQQGKVLAEYVWVGGSGEDLRCKTMVLDKVPAGVESLREWNYDGSSTGQAPGLVHLFFFFFFFSFVLQYH